ncbi:DMSO/TMAO reductase YedYZ molybdopterin-dependent catalytic subunit [Pseudonocardia sediminis]|uniref:DMSO/TMAO reductase YedYZ molybdopterin-dependent catalytic subunit n=1 Tax=Pseudonocardia sediminis TaxID=1397368 RepID=A0A4Q7UU38_PSEST|nr:molybdopterin-dependent oxidoreductase [Pseudonocardia sediminis]RZT83519.1 DMSO/TMAO reductase YedYZ molybdopterin-dependent catalytic subunit [Pseudonocardia sediminis]
MFALPLLIGLPIVIVTGLLDWMAYSPQFGQSIPSDVGFLRLPFFEWPVSPSWLFRLTEGLHIGLGMILVPVVLAKLWSVIPKLFTGPPKGPVRALERLSLVLLVGGILFEIVTGLLNIQYDYVFGFSFYLAHFVGAWVFIAAFVLHVLLKLPTMVRSLRSRSLVRELRTPLSATVPEPPDVHGLVAPDPDPPTMTRRGALALVGGGALFVAAITLGQTLGGRLRPTALLLPRGRTTAPDSTEAGGPNDFPVNRTFVASGIAAAAITDGWALTLNGGPSPVRLERADLAAMPQHTAELPIACVEGWSSTQTWTGVRLRDLAVAAGVPEPASAVVRSVEVGPFARAQLTQAQVLAPDSLLAMQVNGAELSRDHGYPARVIVPALPGVHNTKWVVIIEFRRV